MSKPDVPGEEPEPQEPEDPGEGGGAEEETERHRRKSRVKRLRVVITTASTGIFWLVEGPVKERILDGLSSWLS